MRTKTPVWLGVTVAAFLAGWGASKLSRGPGRPDGTERADSSQATAGAARRTREISPAQWAARIQERSPAEMASLLKGLSTAERAAAVEAWMASLSLTGLSNENWDRLTAMLDVMAAEDFPGAWEWAQHLAQPMGRELVMSGLSASLVESDPEKAFACFSQIGTLMRAPWDSRLHTLISELSKSAAKAGPDRLLELWSRIPKWHDRTGAVMGLPVPLDARADFRGVMDRMLQIGDQERPIFPTSVMLQWASNDPEAATKYLVEKAGTQSMRTSWTELKDGIFSQQGEAGVRTWKADLLAGIPGEQLADFIRNTQSPYAMSTLLAELPPGTATSERQRLAAGLIEAMAKSKGDDYAAIFTELDAANQSAVLEQVRGISDPEPLLKVLRERGMSEDEVEKTGEAVVRQR